MKRDSEEGGGDVQPQKDGVARDRQTSHSSWTGHSDLSIVRIPRACCTIVLYNRNYIYDDRPVPNAGLPSYERWRVASPSTKSQFECPGITEPDTLHCQLYCLGLMTRYVCPCRYRVQVSPTEDSPNAERIKNSPDAPLLGSVTKIASSSAVFDSVPYGV